MSQRRPKDRSHWGDMAFKAMHDKPITREVLHKALQEPTARELLDIAAQYGDTPPHELAARVERVLALHQDDSYGACVHCNDGDGLTVKWPCPTVRALDGEE